MDDDCKKLQKILAADVQFLRDHGIMDYSLLLSAEKYSGGAIKNDRGESIDMLSPAGGSEGFVPSLNDGRI